MALVFTSLFLLIQPAFVALSRYKNLLFKQRRRVIVNFLLQVTGGAWNGLSQAFALLFSSAFYVHKSRSLVFGGFRKILA